MPRCSLFIFPSQFRHFVLTRLWAMFVPFVVLVGAGGTMMRKLWTWTTLLTCFSALSAPLLLHAGPGPASIVLTDATSTSTTTTTTVTSGSSTTTTSGPTTTTSSTTSVPASTTSTVSSTTTTSAVPSSALCGAPANPYNYTYCGKGSLITSPPSDICTYFRCIANFSNGTGYMIVCNDGMVSMSGGLSGACSGIHDGVKQPVYAPSSSTTSTTGAVATSASSGSASSGQLASTGFGAMVRWLILLGGLLMIGATLVRWRLARLATRRTNDPGT